MSTDLTVITGLFLGTQFQKHFLHYIKIAVLILFSAEKYRTLPLVLNSVVSWQLF